MSTDEKSKKLDSLRMMMSDLDNDSPNSDEEPTPEQKDQFDFDMGDRKSPLLKGMHKNQSTPSFKSQQIPAEVKGAVKRPIEIHILPQTIKHETLKTVVELAVPTVATVPTIREPTTTPTPSIDPLEGKQRSLSHEKRKSTGGNDTLLDTERRKSNGTLSPNLRNRALSFSPTKVVVTSNSAKEIIANAINTEDYDELDVQNLIQQHTILSDAPFEYISIFDENYHIDDGVDANDNLSVLKLETTASNDSDDEVSEQNLFSQQELLPPGTPKPSPIGQSLLNGHSPIPSPLSSPMDIKRDRDSFLLARASSIIYMENLVSMESFFTSDKRKALGEPSIIRASIPFFAVGTSRGIIVLFKTDGKVIPLACPFQKCGVTAMDIQVNGEYLVCGYSNGGICLFNTVSLEITKAITNEFSQPIESIAFLSAQKIIAASWEGIKTITFSKILFSVYFEAAIIPGYAEIEHLHVLIPTKDPILTNQYEIVAICSEKEMEVVIMSPLRTIFKLERPKDISISSICCLDWRSAYIPRDSGKPKNALLAIAWGHHLWFHMIVTTKTEIQVVKIAFLDLKEEIVGIGWNGEQAVSVVDLL
jgi:hypothetical protein